VGQSGLPDQRDDALHGLRQPGNSGRAGAWLPLSDFEQRDITNAGPGAASPFYPGFVVGDPSAARYLFLGVDQPSYHAHTLMATLEYRF